MSEESFLLLNLKEKRAKDLAKAMSNESCRKILDFLTTTKKSTESGISKKLNIPLSTVHYNLSQLKKSGLITADEYHYSKKGKEILHYKLAKKYIIISPQDEENFLDKLKKILPLGLFALIGAGAIQIYTFLQNKSMNKMTNFAQMNVESDTFNAASRSIEPQLNQISQNEPNIAVWFLAGSIFIILITILFQLIKKNK